MANALMKRLEKAELMANTVSGLGEMTVIGFVDPSTKDLVRTIKMVNGAFVDCDDKPDAFFAVAMEPIFINPKRFIVIIGGRGSGKSVGTGGIVSIDAHDNGSKTMCLREFQSSIKDSVHGLIKSEVERLELDGFSFTDTTISSATGGEARFAGIARNPDSVKSAFGFKRFWVEEAQFLSESSLKILTPTARNKPQKGLPDKMVDVEGEDEIDLTKVGLIFVGNPGSSEDAFSKRFITPFKAQLDRDGTYQDDLHLIIKMNWNDNPWYEMSGLEKERQWDLHNLPRALYDHIWEGEFNDSVENALIMAEWFDACVDAHVKLGFKAQGAKFAAHDPSDTGPDSKGFGVRHGSVVTHMDEMTDGDVNEGCDWSTGQALRLGIDNYTWDCDGMGVSLNRQTSEAFKDKPVAITMFKGSESPDNQMAIYNPVMGGMGEAKTNADVFRNKRSQYYQALRDRVYNTYRAVIHKEYKNPDDMISFSSDIKCLTKLRAELCRMPIKPNGNGFIELYTKAEMKSKFKMPSPNLGDTAMMLMRNNVRLQSVASRPKPIKPMGRR